MTTSSPAVFRTAAAPAIRRHVRAQDVPDRLVVWTMISLLVASVMLQNLIIPVGGGLLFFDIVPQYMALAVLMLFGRLRLSSVRLILFLLAFGTATILQVTMVSNASLSSMFLAIIIYASYLGVVETTEVTYMRILYLFQYVVLAICLLVYLDIAVQLVHIDMPDINRFVPERLLVQTYVYIQPIMYGSRIMKPNAFFMLEASFTSQFIAVGLVLEIALFRRWRMIAALLIGLICTFATTGILLFALSVPFLCGRHWRKFLGIAIVALPLLAGIAYVSGWAEVQMNRANNIDRNASSFSQRFVIPYTAMWDLATTGTENEIIAGRGAGATQRLLEIAEYNSISKSFVEYGFLFFVLFMIFISYCFFSTGVPFIVMWVCALNYHFMSGNFHLPSSVNYCFVLMAGYALQRQKRPSVKPQRTQLANLPIADLPAPHLAVQNKWRANPAIRRMAQVGPDA